MTSPLYLYMTKGLPGSGKTTWAKSLTGLGGVYTRVNKDDLRGMMHDGDHRKWKERQVLAARDYIVRSALADGHHVVVDDTNFNPFHEQTLRAIAADHEATFEIKDFTDVSLATCLERNRNRTDKAPVPESVIRQMWEKYVRVKPVYDELLPKAVIVDLDGTLAHMNGRGPFEWRRVGEDIVDTRVLDYIIGILNGTDVTVIILSGRDGVCEPETREWLNRYIDPSEYQLYMRAPNDSRRDSIVKRELFEEHIAGTYYPWVVLDDRDQVVRMWRDDLGLTVWQVADGDF